MDRETGKNSLPTAAVKEGTNILLDGSVLNLQKGFDLWCLIMAIQ